MTSKPLRILLIDEFGFFADEGVETELIVEPSWANIADKLAFGFLDAGVIVPPLCRRQSRRLKVRCTIFKPNLRAA